MTTPSRILLIALLAAALGCASSTPEPPRPSAAPTAPDHTQAVDALASQLVEGDWTVGLSIAIVTPDREEHHHYGRRSTTSAARPDDETLYEIGSVTKTFTGLLLAREVVAGRVALNTPVQRCLPEGVTLQGEAPITLLHLATHTSGLPRMPTNFAPAEPADPFADYGPERLHAYLNARPPVKPPGSPYAYSNLGAGLLGYALTRCGDAPSYEALLRAQLLEPLGMTRTTLALPASGANAATGHDTEGRPVMSWTLNVLEGAGGIRSSTAEMARFLRAMMAPPEPLAEAVALATTPQARRPQGRIGLGWHIGVGDAPPLERVVWHNGQTGGFHSFVGYDPKARVGVVVLSNTAQPVIDKLGHALLLTASGEPAALTLPIPATVSPDTLARYAGAYTIAPGAVMTITTEDGKLYAQLTGQPRLRVWPVNQTTFAYRAVDAQLVFFPAKDGAVPRMELHQGGRIIPGARQPNDTPPQDAP